MTIEILEFFLIGFLLLLTPGFAFLCITRIWRDWPALQRWITAAGISLAFYPVLFYLTREIIPDLHLGPRKLWAMLILFGSITLVYFWKERKTLFRLEPLEWVAVGIILLTVVTRFWAIVDRPYPAWSDALHHVLITQLTAQNGQLPYSLEPYAPTPLDMYHLGLYSLTGPVEILTGLPAHTSFLWVSQLLNGLCGLGIYLFLDRKAGRKGALIGLVAIGLWSFQPAWYVNWSRTTSLAANTILCITAVITWEVLEGLVHPQKSKPILTQIGWIISCCVLNAGLFLFHYRVAGYYLPLLVVICALLLLESIKSHGTKRLLCAMAIIAIGTILLILPAFVRALPAYYTEKTAMQLSASPSEYYRMPFEAFFQLGIQKWLFILALALSLLSLLLRNKTTWIIFIWIAALFFEGYSYLFQIPILTFTNISGIAVILYIPVSLLLGMGFEEFINKMSSKKFQHLANALVAAVVLSGLFFIPQRVSGIEAYRYFLTEADRSAMEWIKANTPGDALFAINTYLWMGKSPHGTDGGYWIPYFTNRQTTTSTMLFSLGPDDYAKDIQQDSFIVEAFETDASRINDLCAAGVDYVYIGPMGDFSSRGLTLELFKQVSGDRLVYDENGVTIYQICIND